ncbi:uncharacterized protein LOC131147590 isoform X2 [Malania oleifera]|uniref:uncharacterized protein LOC131147590 isoform X2 n=1 Tax=Malania oleifera TaxID=397392 RepID=UPI0025AE7E5E|nr:uncharacterized protein LOC131147590 isoform X2 [Malania oleifera]
MEVDKSSTLVCTVVAMDHTSFCYRVCSVCERTLPDPSISATPPFCKFCDPNAFNPNSSASKRLFRVLISVASDTKVFVVICFDRAARVLFGCSADEFFDFAKLHPFAAAAAGRILEGEMFRMTLSEPKNGNAQHLRVASVVPLRSGFQPAIQSLRELYGVRTVCAGTKTNRDSCQADLLLFPCSES